MRELPDMNQLLVRRQFSLASELLIAESAGRNIHTMFRGIYFLKITHHFAKWCVYSFPHSYFDHLYIEHLRITMTGRSQEQNQVYISCKLYKVRTKSLKPTKIQDCPGLSVYRSKESQVYISCMYIKHKKLYT